MSTVSGSAICNFGFYIGSNGRCQACPANCLVCQPSNGTLPCYSCNVTYTVNINTLTCDACTANCLNCMLGECLNCAENYLYNQDTKLCEQQQRDANGVVICLKGYYNIEGLCQRCSASGTNCDNMGTVTACRNEFYLSNFEFLSTSTVQCNLCTYKCKTCSDGNNCIDANPDASKYDSTASARGKCGVSQYELNGTCQACGGSACSDCNNMGVCITCNPGYQLVLNANFSNLPYCEACPFNSTCAIDSVASVENICGAGNYINAGTGGCRICSKYCNKCSAAGVCVGCIAAYGLNRFGYCVNQTVIATLYTSGGCAIGYYEDTITSVCTKCNTNCAKCRQWAICDECIANFTLRKANNTCVNETLYNQTQQVVSCYLHYYKSGINCIRCPIGCISCANSSMCFGCETGYTYNTNSFGCVATPIVKCSTGCLICQGAICLTC